MVKQTIKGMFHSSWQIRWSEDEKIARHTKVFLHNIQPNTSKSLLKLSPSELTNIIHAITGYNNLKDTIIVIGGDFNNRDPSAAFEAIDGIQMLSSGPTRGTATLDLIFTNASDHLMGRGAEIFPPLESENGLVSDHKNVWAGLRFEKTKDFKWVRVSVRLRSERREEAFRRGLSLVDWGCLDPLSTDQAVAKFEDTLAQLTNEHFPVTSVRRRSNEKQWITNAIRRKSKKKRRIFRKRGRSERWRALSVELEKEVQESKEAFVDDIAENGGSGKDFYDAVRRLSGPGGGSTWSVRELFPAANDEKVCEEVLDYFASVGGRKRGGEMMTPQKVPSGLHFTPHQVLERLRNLKKKQRNIPTLRMTHYPT